MGYAPNVSRTHSFNFHIKLSFTINCNSLCRFLTFRYSIFNRSQRKIPVESPEKNPSSSMIKSWLASVENTSGAPWTNSCTCLYKVLNGNCFTKCLLGQFLQASSKFNGQRPWNALDQVLPILSISLWNPNWKSMEHVLEAPWANSLTFLHKTIIEVYGIFSKCLLDQFLQFSH